MQLAYIVFRGEYHQGGSVLAVEETFEAAHGKAVAVKGGPGMTEIDYVEVHTWRVGGGLIAKTEV